MPRFLHAADIHLDSPLDGLAARAGEHANTLVGATRRAFKALIDCAIEQAVDFVIIAGDLYDGDWRDFSTGLTFMAGMARLEKAQIQVVIVRGNHDAENQMTRRLTLPPNVRIFDSRKAHSLPFENLRVVCHGRSFGTQHQAENFALSYPKPWPDYFNIGVLHTSATGRPLHDVYAPCSVDDLVAKGYDYWALGHVHKREVLCQDPCWIVFPGNLQGRDVNETGPKGCTLVTVDGQRVVAVEEKILDVARWVRCLVDVSRCTTLEGMGETVRAALAEEVATAGHRTLAVRITLTGASRLHRRLVSNPEATEAECAVAATRAGDIWIERVVVATTDPEPPALASSDALTELFRALDGVQATPEDCLSLFGEPLAALLERLPMEIRETADLATMTDETLGDILADAKTLLLDRLLGTPEERP